MCGRFQLALSWARIAELYGAPDMGAAPWLPSWSVCPTHVVPTVRAVDGAPALELARWGFPTPWLVDQGRDPWSRALINARFEDAARKRTWAGPLRSDRRVVPATAWIEWVVHGGRRLPVRIAAADGATLGFAAVAATFDRAGRPVEAFAILTTSAVGAARRVHDRMPLLVPATAADAWLGGGPPSDPREWGAPDLDLEPLPTSINRAAGAERPPGPADWALSELPGRVDG
jgi:putative SOS response-associated peptidase YedK